MRVLNLGSLNIDYVYRVPAVVKPGQTLASRSFQTFAGGKGANQSVALARAGAQVAHLGAVGQDGRWLVEKLAGAGVDTSLIRVDAQQASGHAIIQVDESGQNAIVIYAGTNQRIGAADVDRALGTMQKGDLLLVQNETSSVGYAIEAARARGMRVCLNPAPFDDAIAQLPLELVDILIVNETEGAGLSGYERPDEAAVELARRYPQTQVVFTLGGEGVIYRRGSEQLQLPAARVQVVDTTAAGDTFLGYFLAGATLGQEAAEALERAVRAAGVCVSRPGAMDSIPDLTELK